MARRATIEDTREDDSLTEVDTSETATVDDEEVAPETKPYVRSGYINAQDFFGALSEAIRTDNIALRDYLLGIGTLIQKPSYITVSLEVEQQYEHDLKLMIARSKATLLLTTLTNSENFSDADVAAAFEALATVCRADRAMMAQALADVR